MDAGSIVLGMLVGFILLSLGYIIGLECGRSAALSIKKKEAIEEFDDDDSSGEWWRKGNNPYKEDDDEA